MLRNPYILRIPKQRGMKSEVAASPLPVRGPKEGTNAMPPVHFRGSPNKDRQNQNWLPHPCLLGGLKNGRKSYVTAAFSVIPKEGGNALAALHSRGSLDKISGCLTLAFSGAKKRAQMLRHPCICVDSQTKADQITDGYLTLAFSGAQKRAKNATSAPRSPNKGGQTHKWLPHPCLLGGPKEDPTAMSP